MCGRFDADSYDRFLSDCADSYFLGGDYLYGYDDYLLDDTQEFDFEDTSADFLDIEEVE